MTRAAVLLVVLALAGGLASVSLGSAPTLSAAANTKPPKCLKWKKVHGKRFCVKRAKPKTKTVTHTTHTTTATTTTTAAKPMPADGHYVVNTSQNTTLE